MTHCRLSFVYLMRSFLRPSSFVLRPPSSLGQQLIDHSGERIDLIAQVDDVAVAGHLAALGV